MFLAGPGIGRSVVAGRSKEIDKFFQKTTRTAVPMRSKSNNRKAFQIIIQAVITARLSCPNLMKT